METKTSQPSVLATRRGKLILALSCAVGFLDFVDASIVNIALPSIRLAYVGAEPAVAPQRLLAHLRRLHAARRTSRRSARPAARPVGRDLAFALSSLSAGLATTSGVLVGSRLVQGVGAALMLPAALCF